MAVLGAASVLILSQPDLGTTLALGMVSVTMLFIAGVRPRYIVGMFLAALPALYLLVFSVPYRRARVLAFLNPWSDPRGSGFQIIQSQIAFGSGGIFGEGLGHSRQKLFYLPAAHTDFIFSIIGEELGLIGTCLVAIAFLVFFYRGMRIILRSPDRFGFYLGLGITLMVVLQGFINISMVLAMMPTKGIALPFMSQGGSSLLLNLIATGVLLNLSNHRLAEAAE
jgi:cell division protein FtsW